MTVVLVVVNVVVAGQAICMCSQHQSLSESFQLAWLGKSSTQSNAGAVVEQPAPSFLQHHSFFLSDQPFSQLRNPALQSNSSVVEVMVVVVCVDVLVVRVVLVIVKVLVLVMVVLVMVVVDVLLVCVPDEDAVCVWLVVVAVVVVLTVVVRVVEENVVVVDRVLL